MRISFLAAIYLLSILGLGIGRPAQAKEYSLPAIRVEVKLRADGSIRITEYRTYKFEGSFS